MAGPKEETACGEGRVDTAGFGGEDVVLRKERAESSLSRCSGVQQDGMSLVTRAERLGHLAVACENDPM